MFSLSRLPWLDIYGKLCPPVPKFNLTTAMPSLCYSVHNFVRYKVGIIIHLSTCLPAAIIAVFQFVPIIRYRFILYHRLAGYTAVLLMTTSLVGACMIADAAMGGICLLHSESSDFHRLFFLVYRRHTNPVWNRRCFHRRNHLLWLSYLQYQALADRSASGLDAPRLDILHLCYHAACPHDYHTIHRE